MLLTIGRGLSRPARYTNTVINSLKDVVSTCVFDLDATMSGSYSGAGQTWANLVASPADGQAKTDYDFYLGAGNTVAANDPTFNGTGGNAAAYFSFDGGDYFDPIALPTGSYLRNIHRTDASRPVTFGFAFRTGATLAQGRLISTNNNTATHGVSLRLDADGGLSALQTNGTSVESKRILAAGVMAINTNYLVLVSLNSGATGSEKCWLNATTGANWNASYVPYTDSSTSAGACIGALVTGHSSALGSGYRLYGAYMFNEILNNAKAASVFAALQARHQRSYS